MLKKIIVSCLLVLGLFTNSVQAHNTALRKICQPSGRSYGRSGACIKIIYFQVKEVMKAERDAEIQSISFLSPEDSNLVREMVGPVLGMYVPSTHKIFIFSPIPGITMPVEQVIAHEIAHAFQQANNLAPSEEQSRDIATLVWFNLFD